MRFLFQRFVIFTVYIFFFSFSLSAENNSKYDLSSLFQSNLHPLSYLVDQDSVDSRLKPVLVDIKSLGSSTKVKMQLDKNSNCYPSLLKRVNDLNSNSIRGIKYEALFLKGILLEICGDLSSARKAYESSLKLRRRNPFVLFRLGVVLLKENKNLKSKEILDEALWRDFSDPYLIHYLNGINLLKLSKTKNALKAFEKSISIKSDFIPPLVESLRVKKELRKSAKSEKEFSKLNQDINLHLTQLSKHGIEDRELVVEYLRHLLLTGDPLTSSNKLEDALTITNEWLDKSNGMDDDMLLIKIQVLEKFGRNEEAKSLIDEREDKGKLSSALKAKKLFYGSLNNKN